VVTGGAQRQDVVRQRIAQRNGAAPASTTQRLQELESLRASGVISEVEYTAKRAQIVSEI
jgi:hypothetical protein